MIIAVIIIIIIIINFIMVKIFKVLILTVSKL